jgi:hypothetical protein
MGLTEKDISRMPADAQAKIRESLKNQGVELAEPSGGVVKRAIKAVAGYISGSPTQAEAAARVLEIYNRVDQLRQDCLDDPSGETKAVAAILAAAQIQLKETLGRLGNHG